MFRIDLNRTESLIVAGSYAVVLIWFWQLSLCVLEGLPACRPATTSSIELFAEMVVIGFVQQKEDILRGLCLFQELAERVLAELARHVLQGP